MLFLVMMKMDAIFLKTARMVGSASAFIQNVDIYGGFPPSVGLAQACSNIPVDTKILVRFVV